MLSVIALASEVLDGMSTICHSAIADSVLQQAFAAATDNFRWISALKSIHI